jgi:formylglycine-generating enzyme required for sulfatase activity
MNKIFVFVALLATLALGQTVSLSGTVTAGNAGGPAVAGAKVYLSNHPGISALTGAQGGFTLNGTGIIRKQQNGGLLQARNAISFVKNRIIVMSKEKQSMRVETFNSRGERTNLLNFNLVVGRNDIAIGNNLQAHGMYMARARIGNDCYTSTFLSMEASQWGASKTKSPAKGLAKRQDGGMDSLVVSAKGYKLAKAGLAGYTAQNIAVAVQPFTPMGMKLIPAKDSSFMMGNDDQAPAHSVGFTHDYYMDSTEISQGDYNAVMQSIYSAYTSPNWGTYGKSDKIAAYFINWNDAILYCNARSKRDGVDTIYSYVQLDGIPGNGATLTGVAIDYQKNGYRLPTEAEWEYACRAGTKTDWYFDTAQAGNSAWFIANSQNQIYPVATKLPNHFGLYDMSGNIWEWANDWYNDYSADPQTDPVGPDSGTEKVWRGGSWGSYLYVISSVYRGHSDPTNGLSDDGFRCVLSK